MKTITNINQQISKVCSAIAALNATNTIVQMIMIASGKPVIRITKNSHCAQLLEQGKASYIHIGQDDSGPYRQGVFYLYGCRIIWSESLH
ncbi:TPA: hypothetical protein G8O65_003931 [Salmonella enterica]|uniref:Uncharacterized protein n=1 Tax=Salmonella enterica TaxID=28901 RepID=A0A761QFV7_SALER|nr:hypothetical protein [Salmonella enterica]HDJ1975267.1 hypothetical protein [Salmonella enterica subsp. enterica]HAG5568700.1 hypothetical protein [Salmonella enterica]HAK0561733.1 hypothetical protein [Salmonella enterica]HAK0611607.1 hypothetical protein [Salmonella enterica]